MTQAQLAVCSSQFRNGQISRLLAATATAAFMAVAGLSATGQVQTTAAQTLAPLDTTKLPRPAAIRQLAAFPQTTIIVSAEPVPTAAKSALTLLEASGWQRYVSPSSKIVQQPTSETHWLKKGSQALSLLVQTTPAQNNATTISYTEMPLNRDLPFPSKATDIQFSPDPLHLDAVVPTAHGALLDFYRAELLATGWILHSASDGSAPKQIATGQAMHHAFFTHGTHGVIHVTAKEADGGKAAIAIRSVPASVLPGAQVTRAPEPVASQTSPQVDAHAQISRQVDAMASDLLKQALQQPPKPAGVEAAFAAARNAGVRVDIPGKTRPVGTSNAAPSQMAAAELPLERDEIDGLPVPKGASSKGKERTNWRVEVSATVKANTPSVLAFYRNELSALGWRETSPARTEAERVIIGYTSPEGPAILTVNRKAGEVSINLLLRKEAEARKSGLMPKAGHARIMFGSMMDNESSVLIGGRTFRIQAGVGSKGPDGPSIEVAPGTHKVTVKSKGRPDTVEMVTVRADDIWGVLLGPGGALTLPIY